MTPFEALMKELDASWPLQTDAKIRLRVIGASALLLQTQHRRGTKDSDILETAELDEPTKKRLLQLAGKDSKLHSRHRVYIDIVANGIPFLPRVPQYHTVDALASLHHFEIAVLDVIDVVVSKLKRFSANDQSDIEAMIELGCVEHATLVARFQSAVDAFSGDARAEHLPRYVENLNQVERDLFGVNESEIELPDWL